MTLLFSAFLRVFFPTCLLLWLTGITVAADVATTSEQPDWVALEAKATAASNQGALASAETFLRSALSTLKQPTGPEAVILWNKVALVHQAQSKFQEAEEEYRRALDANEAQPRPSKVQQAVILNNVGTLLRLRGAPKASEQKLQEARAILLENGLMDTPTAGPVLSNLALGMQEQERFPEAQSFFTLALESFHRARTDDTLEFARCLTNFGFLRFETGHYDDAAAKQRQALQVQAGLPFIANSDRAYTLNNLGLALSQQGLLDEAKSYLSTAAELEKRDPRPDVRLAQTLNNLAVVEKNSGRFDLAQQHEEEALAAAQRQLRSNEPVLASIWNNLGMLAVQRHDYRRARDLYTQAADFWLKNFGAGSPKYAATLSNISVLESEQGHHKQARELARQVLEIDQARLGPNHPQVGRDLGNLAAQFFFAKKNEEAIDLFRRAKQVYEVSSGAASQEVASVSQNLGVAYQTVKRYAEAQSAYETSIRIFKRAPTGSPELLTCLRSYAFVLRKLERFSEAEQADVEASRMEVRKAIEADKREASTRPGLGFRN